LQSIKKLFAPIDMTVGKPWKNLVIFTVPMLIGNVFQQLYSTVDAIIVGRYVGDNALAAIGSTISVLFFIFALFIGIASGAGIMVSQYFGAKRREELSYTIGTCITMITIVAVVITVLGPLVTRPLLQLLNTPDAIMDWAVSYINILLWGILGVAHYNILTGILRGMGDSFAPLVYLIVANVLSMALDLLFVPVFGWGVAGAAIATVIAQFVSSFLCIRRLMKMRDVFDMELKHLIPKKEYIVPMLRLGIPTGISQAVFSLAMVIVQSLINSFGALVIACNVIVMRIDGFVMMPIFAFSTAIMVFTGQNVGAGKMDRVKQGERQCTFLALGTSVVLVAGILLLSKPIARLFTGTEEIVDMSARFLMILALGYIAMAYSQVLWGIIRGAGDTITPMWMTFISVAIRVPAAYLLVYLMGTPDALFISMTITWVSGTLFAVMAYRRGRWRSMGIIKRDAAEA